jgi:hypothetical protein
MMSAGLRRFLFFSRLLSSFVKRGTYLRVHVHLPQMPPHSQQDGDANRHERCGAQHQEHKQNLDHHSISGYQMNLWKKTVRDTTSETTSPGNSVRIDPRALTVLQ